MAGFNALTLTPEFVVTGAPGSQALNATLAAAPGTPFYVAAIVDPVSTQKIFNPIAEGATYYNSGGTVANYLPQVKSITAVTVNDYLNMAINGDLGTAVANIGQIKLILTPGPSNVVEASSVLEYWLSPQAIILGTATGSTTL